jgi:flagellar biosynthetic protein FlhB
MPAGPDKNEKTEEATPRRISQARKKGQIAKSPDLVSGGALMALALFFTILIIPTFNTLLESLGYYLSNTLTRNVSVANIQDIFIQEGYSFFIVVIPFLVLAIASGLVFNLLQTRFLFTTEAFKPDFKRLNPVEGVKNIVSMKTVFRLLKNLAKLAVVVAVAYFTYISLLPQIQQLLSMSTEDIFPTMVSIGSTMIFNIAIVLFAIGVIDYVYQSYDFKKNMRMTKQEVKDEMKEQEGDPQIKGKRRQRQREIAYQRMMADVPKADVIVTNPTHIAVAIRYEKGVDQAPRVLAKGADLVAQRIKNKAKEYDIPIIENKPLARTIYKKVDIGRMIPVELYQAMAEILAIVYQTKKRPG